MLGIVVFAHHPAAFIAIFLLFMGVATAYPQHQERLILREGLLVAFFLGVLVVLGGMQAGGCSLFCWVWMKPKFTLVATALTAITDNAALTYLGFTS